MFIFFYKRALHVSHSHRRNSKLKSLERGGAKVNFFMREYFRLEREHILKIVGEVFMVLVGHNSPKLPLTTPMHIAHISRDFNINDKRYIIALSKYFFYTKFNFKRHHMHYSYNVTTQCLL